MRSELNLLRDRSRLYYEAHVTLEEKVTMEPQLSDLLEELCRKWDMRASTFLLRKPDDEQPHAFISARDPSFSRICERVSGVIADLLRHGFAVRRWKIEDTVLDSSRGDELDSLSLCPASLSS